MASPARHRDRAGKLQLLAVQCWGSEQMYDDFGRLGG